MKPWTYLVYDSTISNQWIFKISTVTWNIYWNPGVYIPERYKPIYLSINLQEIKKVATKI